MFLCGAILTACQKNGTNLTADLNESQVEIKPIVSLTPTLAPVLKPKEKFDIHSKIGIVEVSSMGENCLRTKNGNLLEKTPVSVIVLPYESSQQVFMATVEKKLDESCARPASESGDKNPGQNYYYSLIYSKKLPEEFVVELGIGVIEPPKEIQIENNLASIDLNEDGKPEFFRRCGGFEGTHLTIWTGKPLKGKRIWHSFYYVDYDTVVTCTKKDWEETED